MHQTRPHRPLNVPNTFEDPLRRALMHLVRPALERILRLRELNDIYEAAAVMRDFEGPFSQLLLDDLWIEFEVSEEDLDRIPAEGPVVVVANHPFGGIEGLILDALIRRRRPDTRIMANYLLHALPELRKSFLFVDPFGGQESARKNLAAMREAIDWIRSGHVMGVFPAGEVSHMTLRNRAVSDPAWSDTIARIILKSKAAAVPVFFAGANSLVFQLAGIVHRRLRTLMLPGELLKRRNQTVHAAVGSSISAERCARFGTPQELIDYLRIRTYLLKGRLARDGGVTPPMGGSRIGWPLPFNLKRTAGAAPLPALASPTTASSAAPAGTTATSPRLVDASGGEPAAIPGPTATGATASASAAFGSGASAPIGGGVGNGLASGMKRATPPAVNGSTVPPQAPVVAARDSAAVVMELGQLPAEAKLLSLSNLDVYHARAGQIPKTLYEIGRLREVAFRAVGEGTGRSLDIDRFDEYYVHLFVFNRERGQVVGAYRLGLTDEILPKFGLRGMYSSRLFKYQPRLLEQINPAIELGRSFVRPEYQRAHTSLMLLWKGIGRFISRHPRYARLIGPVSMSNEYQSMSKQLLIEFLRSNEFTTDLDRLLKPRNPPRFRPSGDWDPRQMSTVVSSIKDVDDLVREVEADRRSLPVLLRQYLKFNAKLLGFNVDPAFGFVVDGLMLVDLTQVDHRMLAYHLGEEGCERFLAFHGIRRAKGDTPRTDARRGRKGGGEPQEPELDTLPSVEIRPPARASVAVDGF